MSLTPADLLPPVPSDPARLTVKGIGTLPGHPILALAPTRLVLGAEVAGQPDTPAWVFYRLLVTRTGEITTEVLGAGETPDGALVNAAYRLSVLQAHAGERVDGLVYTLASAELLTQAAGLQREDSLLALEGALERVCAALLAQDVPLHRLQALAAEKITATHAALVGAGKIGAGGDSPPLAAPDDPGEE